MEDTINDEGSQYCSNCKREIGQRNFVMHEAHCRRNIVLCPTCKEPVPKVQMDSHIEEYHIKVTCPLCSDRYEKCQLDEHKTACPKRLVECAFCELALAYDAISQHEDYCGSRTEFCPLCKRNVTLKDSTEHKLSNCQYPRAAGVPPPARQAKREHVGHTRSSAPRQLRERNEMDHEMAPLPEGASEDRSFALDEIRRLIGRPVDREAYVPIVETNGDWATDLDPSAGADGDTGRDFLMARRLQDEEVARQFARDISIVSQLSVEPDDGPIGLDPSKTCLPCEFCNMLLTSDILVHHQIDCEAAHREADAVTEETNPLRLPPRLVDPFSRPNPVQEFVRLSEDNYGDDYLPCEFCEKPCPREHLPFHQSTCPRNFTQTPRVGTPADPQRPRERVTAHIGGPPRRKPRDLAAASSVQSRTGVAGINTTISSVGRSRTVKERCAEGAGSSDDIPCESCGKKIPFAEYQDHTTICYDDEMFELPSTALQVQPRGARARLDDDDHSSGDPLVPGRGAARSRWDSDDDDDVQTRQPRSAEGWTEAPDLGGAGPHMIRDRRDSIDDIPCDTCGRKIPFAEYADHILLCLDYRSSAVPRAQLKPTEVRRGPPGLWDSDEEGETRQQRSSQSRTEPPVQPRRPAQPPSQRPRAQRGSSSRQGAGAARRGAKSSGHGTYGKSDTRR